MTYGVNHGMNYRVYRVVISGPGYRHVYRSTTGSMKRCPVCLWHHASDVPCKPLEKSDNGYTLLTKEPTK